METDMRPRVGVLLANLGTPDAPTPAAVKRYLCQFLSDPRVVEIPPLLWQPILRGLILNTRPKKSAHAYAQVWMGEGSPLAVYTAAQASALRERLGNGVTVGWGMRYGNPSIAAELKRLREAGCDHILFAPLYPQYCGATTASAFDAMADALRAMRWQPSIRTMRPYYDDPGHIAALKSDIAAQLTALPFQPEVLALSFHGMPERTRVLGDPYHDQCRETARLLSEALAADWPALRIEVSFQSRFGKAKWLEPATDQVLAREAGNGVKRLAIATPGFSVDCIETREELAIRGRQTFLTAGGQDFAVLDCLNAGDTGMDMLEALVRRELAGWA